jgi:putative tryptophan/tyrosine transport system substrate-binding protein
MKRREFIAAGLGAVAWSCTAHAQDKPRFVGVLAGFSEDEMRPLLAAFRSRLSQVGWIEGRNLAIDDQVDGIAPTNGRSKIIGSLGHGCGLRDWG